MTCQYCEAPDCPVTVYSAQIRASVMLDKTRHVSTNVQALTVHVKIKENMSCFTFGNITTAYPIFFFFFVLSFLFLLRDNRLLLISEVERDNVWEVGVGWIVMAFGIYELQWKSLESFWTLHNFCTLSKSHDWFCFDFCFCIEFPSLFLAWQAPDFIISNCRWVSTSYGLILLAK